MERAVSGIGVAVECALRRARTRKSRLLAMIAAVAVGIAGLMLVAVVSTIVESTDVCPAPRGIAYDLEIDLKMGRLTTLLEPVMILLMGGSVAFVVFSMFAILVVGAGAQARLAFSMARDNMLPFSRVLRKVNPRSQTPIVALLVFAVIDVGVLIYGYSQPSAFGTLVGATAIIPYIIYFLITLAYAVKRRTTDSIPGAFTLGRWAWPVIGFVLVYSALIMLVLALPAPFRGADKVLLYGFILAVLWYVCALYWRLRRGTAGVKPVDELVD